eukprot:2994280-Rhodomonas_salina.1
MGSQGRTREAIQRRGNAEHSSRHTDEKSLDRPVPPSVCEDFTLVLSCFHSLSVPLCLVMAVSSRNWRLSFLRALPTILPVGACRQVRWWTLKASAHRTRMVRTHPTASTSRACESSSRQLHYSQTACAFADTGTLRVEACFLRTLSLSRLSVTPKLQQRKKERFSGRFPGTLGWGKVNEREEGREKRKAKTQRGRHDEGRKNGV